MIQEPEKSQVHCSVQNEKGSTPPGKLKANTSPVTACICTDQSQMK